MTRFMNREVNWAAAVQSEPLTDRVQSHLGRVYSTLALAVIGSVAGTRYFLTYGFNPLLSTVLTFGLLVAFVFTPFRPNDSNLLRLSLFCAFSFVEGLAIGPFMQSVLAMDEGKEILVMAALSTIAVFTAMSLVALLSKRRSYLYLGGMLFTGLNFMLLSGVANFFFRSPFVFSVELYLGLIVFLGFVVFDTQLIIEKAFSGDEDYFAHALELFLDILNIFIRLVIFFAKLKKNKNKK